MNLLSLDRLSKSLGETSLFEEVSLGIEHTDRIGLVGRNGCGKSTFVRLLVGLTEPDSGMISRKRGLTYSLLEQRPVFSPEQRLGDFFYSGISSSAELLSRHREPGALDSASAADHARLHEELEARGVVEAERSFRSLCTELGLASPEALLASFSGGMLKKAALARALAPGAELLILDEPTNHLDIATIEWLERRLLQYQGAIVVITHDRSFLDRVCSSIMELDGGRIFVHEGGYAELVRRRLERAAAAEKAESRRITMLKREMAWLMRGARARATKSERRKESIRELEASGPELKASSAAFGTARRRLGKKILVLEGVSKAWGDTRVIADFSREFKAGERVGLVGSNGSGKTTFLDLIARRCDADTGRIDRGETIHFAYFDQTASRLPLQASLIEYIEEHAERIHMADGSELTAEQLLERFLFPRAMHSLPLSRLSGGELRRLQLVRLLAEPSNFLLLDEPTNDLDIETIELLEDFVLEFSGCVLVASHDRAFLDTIADFIIVFEGGGRLREYTGGYTDYRTLRDTDSRGVVEAAVPRAGRAEPERRARTPGQGRLSYAERREYEGILDELALLEAEKAELERLFGSAKPEPDALERASRRYAELETLIEERSSRWEELAAREQELQ
ncbi:MAG TPA: ABC-F family ATP-binding cassette domain-containing protein [Rectinemataceae bacterium]|nr:ABC-F family ATP-binding cassette domain-containing protein [Rectinemataceae bacterium]